MPIHEIKYLTAAINQIEIFLSSINILEHLNKKTPSVEWNPGFGRILLDLIESTCSERVGTDDARLPILPLVEISHLQRL